MQLFLTPKALRSSERQDFCPVRYDTEVIAQTRKVHENHSVFRRPGVSRCGNQVTQAPVDSSSSPACFVSLPTDNDRNDCLSLGYRYRPLMVKFHCIYGSAKLESRCKSQSLRFDSPALLTSPCRPACGYTSGCSALCPPAVISRTRADRVRPRGGAGSEDALPPDISPLPRRLEHDFFLPGRKR